MVGFAFKIFLFITLTLSISCTAPTSDVINNSSTSNPDTSTSGQYLLFDNISLNKIEAKTRDASVKIYTKSGGHGSGTYMLYRGYHVVFTAAHVVSDSDSFIVADKYSNKRLAMLVYKDKSIDFAILLIPAFEKVDPISFSLPKNSPERDIGREFIFSGYPGRQSLRTVRGRVAGNEERFVILHSTAWKGSSGSCIFDKKGNFIGVLFAVSMATFDGRPVLLESMIWVEPYSSIDWGVVEEVIHSLN